ncbi:MULTISPECIES: PilW family protein [Vibrio]|uniref:PilW family protein n=1 Tax=Vibrio TaxID=662 RepID=UPI001EF12CCA|nr:MULTISPECIES: pilus assembly protein PilW [Vibrio]
MNKSHQTGASLVELLVASLIGVIVIGTIGSVFISGQKLVAHRGKQLLLTQNLSSTMLQIKEDIQRAGFNGVATSPAMLSGATSNLYIETQPGLVGYVYRVASSGTSAFRNVVFKREESQVSNLGDSLKVCEKHTVEPLSVSSASKSGLGGFCFNVFNPKQISVSDFALHSQTVKGGEAEMAMVTISISAYLVADSGISYQTGITILERNWQ